MINLNMKALILSGVSAFCLCSFFCKICKNAAHFLKPQKAVNGLL
jgi:hypothetical protein